MSTLTEAREQVKAALESAGLENVHTYLPERVTPPAVFVAPSEPYLTAEGQTIGHHKVNLSVVLVAGKGTTSKTVDQLDQMIEDAIVALYLDGISGDVSRPGQITIGGQTYLAVGIEAAVRVNLGSDD